MFSSKKAEPMKAASVFPYFSCEESRITKEKIQLRKYLTTHTEALECVMFFSLENGEFVISDGGYDEGSEEIGYDYERIYQYLKYFNPLKFKKPQIAARILTHEHPDHYNSKHSFAQNHDSDVDVKTLLLNCCPGPYSGMFLKDDLDSFGGETKLIIPHTGQFFDYY